MRNFYRTIYRDDGETVLHGLQSGQTHHPQDGHLQVFRPRHIRCHRSQRHHHGHGVLHDASGTGVHTEDIQLFLHRDLHNRGRDEDIRSWLAEISLRQVGFVIFYL